MGKVFLLARKNKKGINEGTCFQNKFSVGIKGD